jgi:hypothetical protein
LLHPVLDCDVAALLSVPLDLASLTPMTWSIEAGQDADEGQPRRHG